MTTTGRRVRWLLASVALIGASLRDPSQAAEASAGGVRLELPENWRREGAAWVERREGGAGATMVMAARAEHVSVSRAQLGGVKREIEAQMLRQGVRAFQVSDLRLAEVDGTPAYRLRASQEVAGSRIEQLQYIVSGKKTVAITFSCAAEDFPGEEEEFQRLERTLRVECRAGPLDEVPPSLCGAVLGLLAGVGAAARRMLRRRGSGKVDPCRETGF